MNIPLLRRLVPCLVLPIVMAGISVPASSEAADAQLLVNQWIRQGEDGSITGKIVLPQDDGSALAVSQSKVALMSDQEEVRSSETDASGGFRFEGVEPGVYTLMTRGPEDTCSVVALHVASAADQQAAGLPQTVELAAGKIQFAALNTMIIRYLPPQAADAAALVDADAQELPAMLAGPSVYRVAQTNGGMVGQIYGAGAVGSRLSPSTQTNIFLFQNGEEIQRVVSDRSGAFQVQSLAPGVYSALVIGGSGVGLVGFELVAEMDSALTAVGNDSALVKLQQPLVAPQFAMQVAPCCGGVVDAFQGMGSGVVVDDGLIGGGIADTGFGVPMGGGGFAGGGGGFAGAGGGFGGGGGGLLGGGGGLGGIGGLLGIGGLAAGVVALAEDDDDIQIATNGGI